MNEAFVNLVGPGIEAVAGRYVTALSSRAVPARVTVVNGTVMVVVDDEDAVRRQFDESWVENAALDIGGKIT